MARVIIRRYRDRVGLENPTGLRSVERIKTTGFEKNRNDDWGLTCSFQHLPRIGDHLLLTDETGNESIVAQVVNVYHNAFYVGATTECRDVLIETLLVSSTTGEAGFDPEQYGG